MGAAEIDEIVNRLILTKGSFANRDVAAASGLTRQSVHRYLTDLVSQGKLVTRGAGRSLRYWPRRLAFNAHLRREGLKESDVWEDVRSALTGLAAHENAARILQYAFTEMLNNAIDHSRSRMVDVAVELDEPSSLARFSIVDQGIGAFENVRATLGLATPLEALQEISKGKLSTQPERHSGEGIFFTSKVARHFELASNGLRWIVDNERDDQTITKADSKAGTTVSFTLSLETTTTLRSVFDRYSHDHEFDTTRTVVKLFEHGTEFVSRSEAKRLTAGLEKFREVVLDFGGVLGVGQGFADEVFRVWSRAHPGIKLVPERMNEEVAFMVERARRAT
jgi:hypothetical protein